MPDPRHPQSQASPLILVPSKVPLTFPMLPAGWYLVLLALQLYNVNSITEGFPLLVLCYSLLFTRHLNEYLIVHSQKMFLNK